MADEDQTDTVIGQLRSLWTGLSARRRLALVGAGFATLVIVGYMSFSQKGPGYAVLYSGLSSEDAGQIVSKLQGNDVPYRLSANGTSIEVPKDKVHEVRISMASAGYPRGGGIGFEVFDKQSFGTTSFVEQVNYRRAIQGELARTITALDQVEGARVHVAMGRRSVFRKVDETPSASVTVRLRAGAKLQDGQVSGIVHLVASSVDGLTAEKVVVVDDKGVVLSSNSKDGLEAQTRLEQALGKRVRRMVERVVGKDRVDVVVTAEMDYAQVNQTEEVFNQDKPVLRSQARTVEGAGALNNTGGVAGARGNLPGNAAATNTAGSNGKQRLQETNNYEVNRIMKRTVGPRAQVKRLHVAVLVDHRPDMEAAEKAAEEAKKKAEAEAKAKAAAEGEGKEGDEKAKKDDKDKKAGEDGDSKDEDAKEDDKPLEPIMVPRTKEELEQITAIVRQAAGIDDTRGDQIEVRNIEFEREPSPPPVEAMPAPVKSLMDYVPMAVAGLGALILLFFVMKVLKKDDSKKASVAEPVMAPPKLVSLPAPIAEVEEALDRGVDEPKMAPKTAETKGLPDPSVSKRVADAVRADPKQAASVLMQWLADARKESAAA